MRSRHLPYLGAELLCFAPLILPMGEKYHLCPSESQPALGLLYLGEYLLALWCALRRRARAARP